MIENHESWTPYLSRHEIEGIVCRLASRINEDYKGKDLLLIGVLKGASVFMADLFKHLTGQVDADFVRLSSYGREKESSGTITLLKDITADINGRHVLIVEEIIDTGRTLKFLYDRLKSSKPASIEIVTLLDKKEKRLVDVPVKYAGQSVKNEFLIGYGLDLEEKCRNLPDIYYLKYPN